ncbi:MULTISPECIES: preprotein translocase subunit SecG [unclassified Acinetobacter]|uniref:preprotein translocase subunit SecG n=1 Tax=unclassified Acinetobacter TaxID=196816 RepID=UPI0035B6C4C5
MLYNLVLVVHILLAVMIIALVLLQQGKGAEAGASFGGGGAATVFGASGSGNFMSRLTAIFTALFFVTSISLTIMAKPNARYTLQGSNAPASTSLPVTAPAPASSAQ